MSYDTTLPPFLQRMHQNQSASSNDGRHERAIARPKKQRNAQDDEDDAPAYVDEETGAVLSKEEYTRLVKGDEAAPGVDMPDSSNTEIETVKAGSQIRTEREKVASVGASKKRKVGRVVGAVEDDDERANLTRYPRKDILKTTLTERKIDAVKSNKKGKKIKLSFNDD